MKHIPLALERLVRSILSGKTILYTPIYSTFLQIPDTALNAHQKLICQAFMMLAVAAKILDQVKLEETRFQLSAGLIGELTGLSWSQSNRAVTTLADAISFCNKNKLFKAGEKIEFVLTDAEGKQLKKNSSGVSPYFQFEYTAPREKLTLGGKINSPDQEANEFTAGNKKPRYKGLVPEEIKNDYNETTDIHALDKWESLLKLNHIFSEPELKQFMPYSMDRIAIVVAYYLDSLNKKIGIHGSAASLSLKWLSDAFSTYDIHPNKQLENAKKHWDGLRQKCLRIDELIKKHNIACTFTFKHDTLPKYSHYSKIPSGIKYQDMYGDLQEKLTAQQDQEIKIIISALYELEKKELYDKGYTNESAIKSSMREAIILKHFNIL